MDISKENQQKDAKDVERRDSTSAAEEGLARVKITVTDDMFVGWFPPPPNDQPNEKRAKGLPRLSHKKSKTGCQRCRTRRVKCDEVKPNCGGCSRHNVPCFYDHPAKEKQLDETLSEASSPSSSRSVPSRTSQVDSNNTLAESKQRRLLELKLFHQWTLNTCLTFPMSADSTIRDINTTILPTLALSNDALLYCIFFLSALHLVKTDPSTDAREIYLHYYSLTITAHRADVNALSRHNADTVCLTAGMIRMGSFAILQERPLPPYGEYEPPSQWMAMNQGTTAIHRECWKWIGNEPTTISYRSIVQKAPNLTDFAALFAPANRANLQYLLAPVASPTPEPWTPEIEDAYFKALSFIGAIQIALDAGIEGPAEILRRCIAFPGHIPRPFFDMVEERSPRALAILAHYFAYLARFKDIWWIGDAGAREVRAIVGGLAAARPEWEAFVRWPVEEVERVYS